MPLTGERRAQALLSILFVVSILTSTASAASAVLGIDLGTEYIKAALVKPGIPLEIVLTKDSKRKEAAAVAFKPLKSKASTSAGSFPERAYGGDAIALSARFPGDVYSNLKPLLGVTTADSQMVNEYRSRYPGTKIVGSRERDTVSFVSDSFSEEEQPFMVEELLAMELQNVKSNAEAFAGKGSSIRDAVITVPAFYTAEERRALEVAAELAGLRVVSLISDGLSVGLNYATFRTFPVPGDGVKPEYHLVYDMGAGSTVATVLRFQGKVVKDVGKFNKTIQEVQVLGVGWDRSLGGDSLNAVILEDMVSKFADSPRMKALDTGVEHVRAHGRTMAKMWKEAERIRQVLSANTETSASFEGLYHEDVNFKYKLSRSEFEALAAKYPNRVRSPISEALSMAKLGLANIESVILHGGAVRTPFVQKELEAMVGSNEKIRTNVNSDEAAVFGAAFKAAGISPSFRVKDIRTGDIAVLSAGLSWTLEGKEKVQKLFLPTSQIGAEKQVPFRITEDFSFNLYQQSLKGDSTTRDVLVSRTRTENLTASVKELSEKYGCAVADISTIFSIRLSAVDGLPEVSRGSVSCEAVDTAKKGVVDNVKGLFGFGSGSKKGDQAPLVDEPETILEEGPAEATKSSAITTETPKTSKATTSASSKSKSSEKAEEVKRKTQVINIQFTSNATGLAQLSEAELRRVKDRMDAFDASDRSRRLREEALNTLEGYTYKLRDIIEEEGFTKASTKEQRAKIEENAKSASEWLYGDGADATREELKARLKDLRDLVDPIQKRKDEAIKRPDQIKMLRDSLDQTKSLLDVVKEQAERAAIAAASASKASSSLTTETTTAAETSSTTDDGLPDLEDQSSTISTTSTASTSTTSIPEVPLYTVEDLSELTTVYESVEKWLEEKTVEQDKLSPTDDPVITISDLAAKSKELNRVVMDLVQKKMQMPGKSKSSSKSKPSKSKPTKKKTKGSKSSTTVMTEVPVGTETPVEEEKPAVSGKGDIKDEL